MMTTTNTTSEIVRACRSHFGSVIHAAIETELTNPNSGIKFKAYKAVCGKRPPRHSVTHGYAGTREAVNCGKCLKITQAGPASNE